MDSVDIAGTPGLFPSPLGSIPRLGYSPVSIDSVGSDSGYWTELASAPGNRATGAYPLVLLLFVAVLLGVLMWWCRRANYIN